MSALVPPHAAYNQVVGSVGLTTMRVSNQSCEYKSNAWANDILKSRRKLLYESEQLYPACYGAGLGTARMPASGYGMSTDPYGPFCMPIWDSNVDC